MTYPVHALTTPGFLAGKRNGQLPSEILEQVGPTGFLVPTAARAYRTLYVLAKSIGIDLTFTYGGCYRSFTQQLNLFLSRYRPVSAVTYWATPASRRKRWHEAGNFGHSSTYWVKKQLANGRYPATAATPGYSNHGWGLAVDIAYGGHPSQARAIGGHPRWRELQALILECGFSWELQSEPWHIRYNLGDGVAQKILDVENFLRLVASESASEPVEQAASAPTPEPAPAQPVAPVPSAPPPAPAPTQPTPTWTEMIVSQLPVLRQGARGDAVRRMQGLLLSVGQTLTIDGHFGPQTDTALRRFQRASNVHGGADGVAGRHTWAALLGVK